MPLANAADRYGSLAKFFHWLTALLIFTLIPMGIVANRLPFSTGEELAQKALLFSLHKTLGLTLFFVALARIAWALRQVKPAGLHPERKMESFLAETVHWLLYGSLVLVPLSGWVHHAATTGFAPIWWPFGQGLPFVPKSETLADMTAGLHIVFERVLVVSILLHLAGALKHHFIDRDDTLRRMLPGVTRAGSGAGHSSPVPMIVAALAVWAAAIGAGAGLGAYGGHSADAPVAAALDEVHSDWRVETGTLGITVTQFGSEVAGQFADWTAEISFEPGDGPGPHGAVRAQIAIATLTLGSVTEQALGPDYFDASTHPTAVFDAEIFRQADGYEAVGTLTLKGATVDLTLPFDLELEGDTARMSGSTQLDRRSFSIGDNMPDEGSLGFAVTANIALSAKRAGSE